MTCIDKLRELHPEWSERIITSFVIDQCPSDEGIMDDPDCCIECSTCWHREIACSETSDKELWRTNFLGMPYRSNFVEFDIDEQRMIREMVAITGRDKREIIREGVRYLYDEIKLWDAKKTEYYKPAKVEWL